MSGRVTSTITCPQLNTNWTVNYQIYPMNKTNSYNDYAYDQIEAFLCDLINSDDVQPAEISISINKMIADLEDYHSEKLNKIRTLRASMFNATPNPTTRDTREVLYEEITRSGSIDLI